MGPTSCSRAKTSFFFLGWGSLSLWHTVITWFILWAVVYYRKAGKIEDKAHVIKQKRTLTSTIYEQISYIRSGIQSQDSGKRSITRKQSREETTKISGGVQHQSSAQALQEGEEEGPCKPATPSRRIIPNSAPQDLRHHEWRDTTLDLATSDMHYLSEATSDIQYLSEDMSMSTSYNPSPLALSLFGLLSNQITYIFASFSLFVGSSGWASALSYPNLLGSKMLCCWQSSKVYSMHAFTIIEKLW